MYWARRALWLGTVGLLVAALLGTTPAGASTADLKLIRVRGSLLGTHYWYQQTYRGLPVIGGYYARHVDRMGREFLVRDGRRQVVALTSTVPSVPRSRAATVATMRAEGHASRADLAVLPGDPARLVWAVSVNSPSSDRRVLVDARSGTVRVVEDLIKEATGSGRVFDPNPVVTLQDESLTDRDDANYARLRPAYQNVSLAQLDGSGFLIGDFANIALKRNGQRSHPRSRSRSAAPTIGSSR